MHFLTYFYYRPFQGGASVVDPFRYLFFLVCLCYHVLTVPRSRVITCWEMADFFTLLCVMDVFLCFVAFL